MRGGGREREAVRQRDRERGFQPSERIADRGDLDILSANWRALSVQGQQ
jgi:hypothetical protein